MVTFKNDSEKEFWMKCIKHAENKDLHSGNTIEATFKRRQYTEYADDMVLELRKRESKENN